LKLENTQKTESAASAAPPRRARSVNNVLSNFSATFISIFILTNIFLTVLYLLYAARNGAALTGAPSRRLMRR
jgi:preprotein translocase subunit SecG